MGVRIASQPVGTPALGPADANGGLGAMYVTDQPGGVSAYTLDGGYLWRAASGNDRRASSGPVVGPDGTIYFTAVDRLQAINPDGTLKWSSAKLPGTGRRDAAARPRRQDRDRAGCRLGRGNRQTRGLFCCGSCRESWHQCDLHDRRRRQTLYPIRAQHHQMESGRMPVRARSAAGRGGGKRARSTSPSTAA